MEPSTPQHSVAHPRLRRETENRIPEKSYLKQTIIITDKFGFKGSKKFPKKVSDSNSNTAEDLVLQEAVSAEGCMNTMGLVVGGAGFLLAQLILIMGWAAMWQRRRRNKLEEPLSASTTTESLRQLYDSGYPRRV